jgi:DNA primase large subunit
MITANEALKKAKEEIREENMKKSIELFKKKLREREAAQTVLANVDRELNELQLKIEQGNV